MRGDPVPHGLRIRFHQQPDHVLDLLRRQLRLIGLLQALAGVGKCLGHRHAGGVVQRVVQRPDRHVRHAGIEDAVRALPADMLGEIDHSAGTQRLVAGVARLASHHGVLQIDQPEEQHLVAQLRPHRFVGREAKEQAIGALHVAAHRRDHVRVQPVLEPSSLDDRLLVVVPHHRAIAWRRHVHALHRGVAAGILAAQLVPDVEAGGDIPHALQHPQQAVLFRQILRQIGRGAQAQDGVVVVDQRDLPVAHIHVVGHLDERRLCLRHHAECVAHRASVAARD